MRIQLLVQPVESSRPYLGGGGGHGRIVACACEEMLRDADLREPPPLAFSLVLIADCSSGPRVRRPFANGDEPRRSANGRLLYAGNGHGSAIRSRVPSSRESTSNRTGIGGRLMRLPPAPDQVSALSH